MRRFTRWCHLWCDAGDEEQLHALAARIGMKRAWYQHQGKRWPHYDLVPARRAAAVKAGAIEMDWKAWYRTRFMGTGESVDNTSR